MLSYRRETAMQGAL